MYPSNYGYAVLASSCARTTNLSSYRSTSCAGNNWLKTGSYQWTLTPDSSNSCGLVGAYSDVVRPSIYLKSNIKIFSEIGSSSEPYILSL